MTKIQTYRIALRKERVIRVSEPSANSSAHASRIFLAWYREHKPAGECVLLLGVNANNDVVGLCELARGGAHGAALTPREPLQAAMAMGATAFVLAHNHPSERVEPSAEDLAMTRGLREACSIMGIPMLDHLVLAPRSGEVCSIYERMRL
jgi:DNA repair protein RadC